jgi:hypothetical protein
MDSVDNIIITFEKLYIVSILRKKINFGLPNEYGVPSRTSKRHLLDLVKNEVNGKDVNFSRPKYRMK